jgi:hypothetical protein
MAVAHSDVAIHLLPAAPSLQWRRILLSTLVTCVVSVGALELFWRAHGIEPDVPDSVTLWKYWRTRVYQPSGKVLVFLGTSRIRTDIDLESLSQALPRFQCVQLGVSGDVSPIGTVRSLALDPAFHGIVVCELAAPFLAWPRWDDQKKWSRQPDTHSAFEQLLGAYIRDKAALLNPRVTIGCLGRDVFAEPIVSPTRCRSSFTRFLRYRGDVRGAPFDDVDAQVARQEPTDARTVAQSVAEIGDLVQCIQARGGAVVFVSLPLSTGIETTTGFPDDISWPRILGQTGAVCISLEGDASGRFHCADGVHLDQKQAKRLTNLLIMELYRNRVIN